MLGKREHGFVPREQSQNVLHGKGTSNNGADVSNEMLDRPNLLDAVFRAVTFLYLDYIASAIFKNTFYTEWDG